MNRARVILFNSALGPLDYRVPADMEVEPGSLVEAPLGPRRMLGVVWEEEAFDVELMLKSRVPMDRLSSMSPSLPSVAFGKTLIETLPLVFSLTLSAK